VKLNGDRPATWEGHGGLAELDHANPAVAELVTEIMLFWLRRGIAGWRLDVAYAVPAAFWAHVIDRVRLEFPGAVFLGEVIHGDYVGIVRDGHLDSVTQYELWKAIWSSINDRNLWELAWALQRHAEFTETFLPQTFVGNHDVDRIADQIGPDGAALAAIVLATVPGMPSIYYGDEQGFTGHKGEGFGADLPLRPALPDSPAELAAEGWWLYRLHQDVIGLRRRNPWLTRGVVEVVAKTNTELTYRISGEGHAAVVRLWLEPQPHALIEIDGQPVFAWPR
jgi:glycosidase